MTTTAIVLAAGEGTRMKSGHAKVSHKILDKPMVSWVADAARAAGCDHIVVVVGSHGDEVREILSGSSDVDCVEQTERLGTGHAVRCALEATQIQAETVVVLNADVPLIEATTIASLVARIKEGFAGAVLTMTPPDPFGYGRIDLDEAGEVVRIIEQKDCTPEQSQTLLECNAGCYAFCARELRAHIADITTNNVQGEYYLTDMIEILRGAGLRVGVFHCDDFREALGVNSRAQLAEVGTIARDRINARLMAEGTTMLDPTLVWVGPDVVVGRDTVLLPLTMLMGATSIGCDCVIGPNTRLTDCTVADGCSVEETVGIQATLEADCTVGPRAYLRPGTHLLARAHVGTHVEIKNSTIGEGSKVPHLSYIGDTTMGSGVNIGAGSITCNYDGFSKHPTTIGNDVFVGSDTMMVAPVRIGDGAIVGASSCITSDVPEGALALERSEQRVVEGYAKMRMRLLKKKGR